MKICAVRASRMALVASFAEAWIEKSYALQTNTAPVVASFAEAWIENHALHLPKVKTTSPPSRRRGLKNRRGNLFYKIIVASFAEAWIENLPQKGNFGNIYGRLLRGGVD